MFVTPKHLGIGSTNSENHILFVFGNNDCATAIPLSMRLSPQQTFKMHLVRFRHVGPGQIHRYWDPISNYKSMCRRPICRSLESCIFEVRSDIGTSV